MTTTPAQDQPFKVLMHSDVGDLIDYQFSPMEGAVAVAQVYDQLPLLHRPARPRWWHRLIPRYIRLYRGELEWGPVGFSYVQIGDTLHVIDGGGLVSKPDTVLPEPDFDQYILDEEKHSGGVSVFTIG